MNVEKLDNPVYFSLSEVHKDIAIDEAGTKFYKPQYCPFGGFLNYDTVASACDSYALLATHFFVVGEKPVLNNNLRINKELICNQMIIDTPIDIDITEDIIELQTEVQKNDLLELINKVQPGYFRPMTTELGNYYGIYNGGQLIAATGERMKMNDFTEISAVVTHPEHTGKGYAKQLVSYTSNAIFKENKKPYLHVVDSNIGAISLYEKLGFRTRRKISFWDIETK